MTTLRTRLADSGLRLMGPPMKLVNGFPSLGMALYVANQYSLPLAERSSKIQEEGILRDGTPYKMVSKDVATEADRRNGIRHYHISCEVEGRTVGRVQIRSRAKYVDEFERTVYYDGWYLFDGFVEPLYRGMGVITRSIDHAFAIASRSGNEGPYVSGFVLVSNIASRNMVDRIGFSKQATIVYLKVFGRKRLFIKTGRSTKEPFGVVW